MNLSVLDLRLIALLAALIVILTVVAWLYVRNRRSTTADMRKKFGPEYERAVLTHGSEQKQKRSYRIARSGLTNSTFAIWIRWSMNAIQSSGRPCSPALSIPRRARSRKRTTWFPLS